MRFDRAMIGIPSAGSVGDAVAYACALLRPGAQVVLLPDPTPAAAESLGHIAEWLAALEARTEAVRAALVARGVEVVDALDPAQVVILPDTAPQEVIASVLTSGVPVALLACPMPPVRAVGVVAWNDPRRVRPISDLLVAWPSDAALHQISIRGAFQTGVLHGVLGLPEAPRNHALQAGYFDAREKLRGFLEGTPLDLLAVMATPGLWLRPLLELTSGLAPGRLLVPGDDPLVEFQRRIELFAAVEQGGRTVVNAVSVDATGGASVAEDQAFVAVSGGRSLGPVHLVRGQLQVPSTGHLAIGLVTDADHAALTMEAVAVVLRAEGAPIVLVPVDLPAEDVAVLRGPDRRVWALATTACSPSEVRARTGADAVLHAGAVLADGGPWDVPSTMLAFGRAARHLRALGFPIAVVMTLADGPTWYDPQRSAPIGPDGALGRRLEDRCGARACSVTDLHWQTDNREARARVIQLIDGAKRRVHLQAYIFEDDEVGRAVAKALTEAAGRGVEVRVLVDSLWSRHGSLKMESRLFVELLAIPSLLLAVFRPVAGVQDLKQRNHRKMLLVDGAIGVLPGRNLAHHYYAGFDEVPLSPVTSQDTVPWIDLSTEIAGPAIDELERIFAQDWVESGGPAYEPAEPSPKAGQHVPVWVIPHRGLEDAATLDAFRVLFDEARERITLINTFPLQHELQHALLERLRAGIAVRFLTGHVRPRFQGGLLPFPGSAARDLMTELVHGRLDPLVAAGADVYAVGIPDEPGWDPAVGRVMPHVHSKWVSVDGSLCAVGSANLDISSTYWESEVMLIVRDPERVGAMERWVDELLFTSTRFDPQDAAWQARMAQRAWISQNWPGVLS